MKPQISDTDFEKIAHGMIAQKKHAQYMKQALEKYHAYVQFMAQVFLEESSDQIFTIRATYRPQKNLWREIEIRGTQTLAELATAIIESMGWTEDHFHGFWFPDKRRNRIFGDYGIYYEGFEDDPHPWFKTKDILVSQIDWERNPTMGFVFDFGEGHEFDIAFKTHRGKEKDDKKIISPRLVDQRGVAPEQYPPLEDSGKEHEQASGSMEDFLFDDCDICQTQKEAILSGKVLTKEELTNAFAKARKKEENK